MIYKASNGQELEVVLIRKNNKNIYFSFFILQKKLSVKLFKRPHLIQRHKNVGLEMHSYQCPGVIHQKQTN